MKEAFVLLLNVLWASMGEERLQNLSILAIEKKLASELSLDALVDIFASEVKNRRILFQI